MNPFRIDFRIIQTQPLFRMHRIVAHADFREESRCFFVVFRICVRSVDEIKTQIREHHPTLSGFSVFFFKFSKKKIQIKLLGSLHSTIFSKI